MNLTPDRRLVRRWRRATRTLVNARPDLRRERKRVKGRWTRNLGFRDLRWAVPLFIAGGTLAAPTPNAALPVLVWWTLVVTLFRAGHVSAELHTSPALWMYYQWPVESAAVFRQQAWRVGRAAIWLAVDWLAFGLVAAARTGGAAAWLAAPFFAVVQAITALALAVLLARWRPRFPFAPIAAWMGAATWFLVQFSHAQVVAGSMVAPFWRALLVGTPAGRVALAEVASWSGGVLGWLTGIGLAAAGVAWLRFAVARIAAGFSLDRLLGDDEAPANGPRWEPAEPDTLPAVPEAQEDNDPDFDPSAIANSPNAAATASADVDLRALRAKLDDALTAPAGLALFNRGWLESRATRLLSLRQRILIDFLQPRDGRWSKSWLTALALLAMTAALRIAGFQAQVLVWLPIAALVLFGLPVFGGNWLGFAALGSSGGQIGFYAFVPIGFFEMLRTVLAVNVLRCAIGFPLVVLAARFGFTPTPSPWPEALGMAWRVTVLALAVLPIWTVLAISRTTNDSSARWWFTLLVLGVIVTGILVGFGFGIALFAVESPLGLAGCVAGTLGFVYSFVALYGWIWGRRTFDLVGKSPRR